MVVLMSAMSEQYIMFRSQDMVSENALNKCVEVSHYLSACEVHIRTYKWVVMSVHPHVSYPELLTRF